MSKEPSKGYLVVASLDYQFYVMGLNLIRSIKDVYPEAQVCFVVEEAFCDGEESIADHIIHCGNGIREKLWALSQTPFDITMYMDADMECVHEDISTVFDMLDGHDLMFTPLKKERDHYFKPGVWDNGRLELHGGVFAYDIRNPLVKEFMEDWYRYYQLQTSGQWWPDLKDGKPDYDKHPKWLSRWDQFTLWYLTNKDPKYKDLKIKHFEEEVRWNWTAYYLDFENATGKDIILNHLSGAKRFSKSPLFQP